MRISNFSVILCHCNSGFYDFSSLRGGKSHGVKGRYQGTMIKLLWCILSLQFILKYISYSTQENRALSLFIFLSLLYVCSSVSTVFLKLLFFFIYFMYPALTFAFVLFSSTLHETSGLSMVYLGIYIIVWHFFPQAKRKSSRISARIFLKMSYDKYQYIYIYRIELFIFLWTEK